MWWEILNWSQEKFERTRFNIRKYSNFIFIKNAFTNSRRKKAIALYSMITWIFYKACMNGQEVGIENLQKHFGSSCSEEIPKSSNVPNDYLEICLDQSFDPAVLVTHIK